MNRSFIWRVYCHGIPPPDTWGHGYQIDDLDNDLDNDDNGGSSLVAFCIVSPSRIRASRRHLASRDGASLRDRIRPSASRGRRFSPTSINDDVDDDEDNIFCHHRIIDPLRCRDCAASAAAIVVVQVIVPVVDSISMAPRIRARNYAAVNSQDKTTIPVSLSSVTNGTDGIDGIDVRGYQKKR